MYTYQNGPIIFHLTFSIIIKISVNVNIIDHIASLAAEGSFYYLFGGARFLNRLLDDPKLVEIKYLSHTCCFWYRTWLDMTCFDTCILWGKESPHHCWDICKLLWGRSHTQTSRTARRPCRPTHSHCPWSGFTRTCVGNCHFRMSGKTTVGVTSLSFGCYLQVRFNCRLGQCFTAGLMPSSKVFCFTVNGTCYWKLGSNLKFSRSPRSQTSSHILH